MSKVSINIDDHFIINSRPLSGDLKIEKGQVSLIFGENGIGKSTLFHYFKKNRKKYFKDEKCVFTDQYRYTPLNEVSFDESLKCLNTFRIEKIDFYEKNVSRISSFSKLPINTLSGGQNQLVKIFTSLYLSGDVFFFDEPLQYLDKENVEFVINLIKYLKDQNKAICIIEHNKEILFPLIDLYFEVQSSQQNIVIKEHNGF